MSVPLPIIDHTYSRIQIQIDQLLIFTEKKSLSGQNLNQGTPQYQAKMLPIELSWLLIHIKFSALDSMLQPRLIDLPDFKSGKNPCAKESL